MEVREDDEEFQNPVDLMFEALEKKSRITMQSVSIKNTSWLPARPLSRF